MTNANWRQAKEIFIDAMRRTPEERPHFLELVCGGDKLLRSEVESLLTSHDEAKSFLESPAVGKFAESLTEASSQFANGQILAHYEIIEKIGSGGMGEVYLAKDKKLDRQVAFKILNEKFSRDESNLNRFVQEAKAVSALNHPNILVIHEIGETDETHYIVSEFIKGVTLREILKDDSLKLSEILDISIQISNALTAAHEARLAHRDIKPENIMIRPDGFVKVLDFGLAKLVERKNKAILGLTESAFKQNETADGIILGTINYMSPEQAKGKKIDERTDIFSLGVVIYEMLTGNVPFAGDSVIDSLANLVNAEPPPLSRFSSNVPAKLQRIVAKTLRKNKDERYQSTKDLLSDLKDLRENSTLEEKPERRNGKSSSACTTDEQSAADSIQASIPKPANAYQAYQLARYHFQQLTPTDLIKSRSLLEEAVRFDADFAAAYAALAEQSLMEGMYGLRAPVEIFPKAKDALRRAFDLNPHSTEFYAAAGFVDLVCDWNLAQAEENLVKALELNAYNAFANGYLGQVFMFRCRAEEAEFYLRRAVGIEPTAFNNRIFLAIAYFLGRNYQKAIEECEKMLAVYPHFLNALWMRCCCLEQTGRAAEAIAEYEKLLREPDGEIIRRWMGYAYALLGDTENALATVARVEAERNQAHFISQTHLAALYAASKDTDKATACLENAVAERDPWLLWLAADPRFDNLRSDSRFDDLIKRIGLK